MEHKEINDMVQSKIERLKSLMTIGVENIDFAARFKEIAEFLFSSFAIKRGNNFYLFKDIEFYYYNNVHRDIITHPRKSEALCWYVNDFGGIDLNFESSIGKEIRMAGKQQKDKFLLTEDDYFGGILIRQLQREDTGTVLSGPWACAELFRKINAIGIDKEFPVLIEHESKNVHIQSVVRLNLLRTNQSVAQKVDYILKEQYHEHPEHKDLCKEFEFFRDKPYRYYHPKIRSFSSFL